MDKGFIKGVIAHNLRRETEKEAPVREVIRPYEDSGLVHTTFGVSLDEPMGTRDTEIMRVRKIGRRTNDCFTIWFSRNGDGKVIGYDLTRDGRPKDFLDRLRKVGDKKIRVYFGSKDNGDHVLGIKPLYPDQHYSNL